MRDKSVFNAAILGIFVGLGIMIAGFSISHALFKTRAADRYVTVKGLAEREVDADLAIWPITFKDAGNDLAGLQDEITRKREVITDFLLEKGFDAGNISHSAPRMTDAQAETYYGGQNQPRYRYTAQTTVTLRSSKVGLVKETMERSGDLVSKGIVFSQNWENRTEFLFTGLNEIKPEMIQEATIDARKAAQKFADDSGSQVGNIRRATQGFFSITNRDQNSPDRKVVRVVTTVEYFLVDH